MSLSQSTHLLRIHHKDFVFIILLPQFPLTFPQIQKRMALFIVQLLTILVLIGSDLVIIEDMFHGKISLNSMLLLMILKFVSGFTLELINISLVVSSR